MREKLVREAKQCCQSEDISGGTRELIDLTGKRFADKAIRRGKECGSFGVERKSRGDMSLNLTRCSQKIMSPSLMRKSQEKKSQEKKSRSLIMMRHKLASHLCRQNSAQKLGLSRRSLLLQQRRIRLISSRLKAPSLKAEFVSSRVSDFGKVSKRHIPICLLIMYYRRGFDVEIRVHFNFDEGASGLKSLFTFSFFLCL